MAPLTRKSTHRDIFRIVVNHEQSIEEMLAATGILGIDINNDVKHFMPFWSKGKGIVESEVSHFCFNQEEGCVALDDVVEEIRQADMNNPWSPANIRHLLSLITIFPKQKYWFNDIFALGSVVIESPRRRSPFMFRDWRTGPGLSPYWWWDNGLPHGYSHSSFLAIRNISIV